MFFWDTLESQPHDVDVKAVPPKAVLYNIPTAFTRQSGHFDFQCFRIGPGYPYIHFR